MRQKQGVFSLFLLSPSSRRAWIEMPKALCTSPRISVALLAEGVDRNHLAACFQRTALGGPPTRGRG